ncbi:dynamin family protein [Frigoriflavimonas asaccharolytica]|uniref:Small GTP-binding protein n=1 Tax=Frigoriflavimonas asaccharolytica TaxID=2735899 RepID=A0A8J8K969_9FLAO|nr:dynamin family protein [Frigoriflavimonas asaccharolytica]NRS93558.1 small GTP-binding protein [Frigoriflavimonas asaccharolytica]
MIEINRLIEISKIIDRADICNELELLKIKSDAVDKEITIPLVGEFSSGKTSIINALIDNKKLETASKATTATIFEIKFGNDSFYAESVDQENNIKIIEDLEDLKNGDIEDLKLVRVFDTSNKVPSSTVLVDTPGLSSNDIQHKISLTSYLPYSDAILLVLDINQQVTRSLLDFIDNTKLAEKPLYLIINKCDTKTEQEIEEVKKYFIDNINIKVNNIVCISAARENLEELYQLFDNIQKEKNEIVNKAIDARIKNIGINLSEYINDLLTNLNSNSSTESQIEELQIKLRITKNNITRWLDDSSSKIEEKLNNNISQFRKIISERLDNIVKNNIDCDTEVNETVNIVALTILQNFKKDIQYVLTNLARERKSKIEEVPLQVLESMDLSSLSLGHFSHNMKLSELGHKHDKIIGGAVIAAGVAATLYFTGGGAVILGFLKNTTSSPAVRTLVMQKILSNTYKTEEQISKDSKDSADRASRLAELNKKRSSNDETANPDKDETVAEKEREEKQNLETLQEAEKLIAQFESLHGAASDKKGIIEKVVGGATDSFFGKPQRRRRIDSYVEDDLLPQFKMEMESIRNDLQRAIGLLVNEEAEIVTSKMEDTIVKLEDERKVETELYDKKIKELKEAISYLNN